MTEQVSAPTRRPMTTSEQARADAMADAETLMRFTTVESKHRYDKWARLDHLRSIALGFLYPIALGHAAFHAVPGLRGDSQED